MKTKKIVKMLQNEINKNKIKDKKHIICVYNAITNMI